MAVIIPNSAGYGNDSVDAPEWAQLIPNAGRQYGVLDEGSWVARVGGADREVRLTPGTGYGCGILDRTTAEASIVLPATSSGSVYHLIHVRRDWGNNRSSFDSKVGTSARQIPARATTVGSLDDQPLWLARVDAGKSQVQELIDLRVWGGAEAKSELVLQYMTQLGTRIRIGRVWWTRGFGALGNPQWFSSREPAFGLFDGLTKRSDEVAAGTATVSHDLGVVPTSIVATNHNSGGEPYRREILVTAATDTQIQFGLFRDDGILLTNYPVKFSWAAFA